jgi:hypothetical protein
MRLLVLNPRLVRLKTYRPTKQSRAGTIQILFELLAD